MPSLKHNYKSRLDILQECLKTVEDCNNEWYQSVKETLGKNNIVETFSSSVKTLLDKGCGKFRNLLIIGPANCGKTSILKPLTLIHKTFTNLATSTFVWNGAESAEIIFLNDFQWNNQLIRLHDVLLLLEGVVHIPAPKTNFANDNLLSADKPILVHQVVKFSR